MDWMDGMDRQTDRERGREVELYRKSYFFFMFHSQQGIDKACALS